MGLSAVAPVHFQLAFTESPLFIGPISDDSSYPSANTSYDGALDVNVEGGESESDWVSWTLPREKLRGGFRYLTIVAVGSSAVRVANVSVSIEFLPHWEGVRDMRNYSGYFYATGPGSGDVDIFNKAWYAGVSTSSSSSSILPLI